MKKRYLTPKIKALDVKMEKVLLHESGTGGRGFDEPGTDNGEEEGDF